MERVVLASQLMILEIPGKPLTFWVFILLMCKIVIFILDCRTVVVTKENR